MTIVNQPIFLHRGKGWDDQYWEQQQPAVERAVQKAAQGIAYLGITYVQPKRGSIHRYALGAREDDTVGRAFDATHFELYEELSPKAPPRLTRHAATWSAIVLHEVIHCVRFESEQRDSCVELAASEGLAYIGEREHIGRFCGKQAISLLFESDLDRPDQRLREELQLIARAPEPVPEHYAWFNATTENAFMRDGALYGAQCVWQHLQRGHTFADLMRQPAEEILDL